MHMRCSYLVYGVTGILVLNSLTGQRRDTALIRPRLSSWTGVVILCLASTVGPDIMRLGSSA
ncbi:hypothetical protein BV20DRAFT_970225 [Pilatotrama ljubarskyi]|nr:hypothetical protein BV20DRAFT_970225 [Pilatotrama ljubarskyi]